MLCVWVIGALAYLRDVLSEFRQGRKALHALPGIKSQKEERALQRALEKIYPKRRRACRLLYKEDSSSPAVSGLISPTIILPAIAYDEEELYYVFLHELLHFKHKDFLFKVLLNILGAVYWWNPLISRHMFPVVNQIQELLVDSHLTQTMKKVEKEKYLEVLEKTLKRGKQRPGIDSQCTYALVDCHQKESVRQRLKYIINVPQKKYSRIGIAVCLLLFVLSFTFVLEPSYTPKTDEYNNPVYTGQEDNSYYIKNGQGYDLYLDNTCLGYVDGIVKDLEHLPIYNSKEEVPK